MGLARVRASLEGAVAALFEELPTAPTNGSGTNACVVCGGALALPSAAWHALRELPVCARFVVAAWRRLAPLQAPNEQPPKRQKSTVQSNERCAASFTRLCSVMYQCGLLVSPERDDSEVVAMLLDAIDERASADRRVLCRVLQQQTLARHVRLRLFHHALCTQEETRVDSTWVGEVARAFQEELRLASIEPLVHTGQSAPSTKNSRKRGRGSMGTFATTTGGAQCEVCAADRVTTTRASGREALFVSLTQWLRTEEGHGDAAVEAVKGLVDVLRAPEVVQLLERTSSRSATLRPNRGASGRTSRLPLSLKLRWDECDKIADALSKHAPMWRLVWRRERSRVGSAATFGTLTEVITLCAVADQFASSTPRLSERVDNGNETIGFRVIQKLALQAPKSSNPIITILRALSLASDHSAAVSTSLVPKVSLHETRCLLLRYARLTIRQTKAQDDQVAHTVEMLVSTRRHQSPAKKEPKAAVREGSTMSDLVECVELIHAIVINGINDKEHVSEIQRRELFALWFQLVSTITLDASARHGSAAMLWSSFLDAIAQCCEAFQSRSYKCTRAFEGFVSDVVTGVIVSGGARLTSPDACLVESIPVPTDDTSQSMLQALLGLLLSANQGFEIVASLLCRLLVVAIHQTHIHSSASRQRDRLNYSRLLFPLLGGWLSGLEGSREANLSHVVGLVRTSTQSQYNNARLARALVILLHEWDSYSVRQNRDIAAVVAHPSAPIQRDRSGMRAMREHGLWQDLVRFYASDDTDSIARETSAFLGYVLGLLRSIDKESCPSELEGTLFSVVARISTARSQAQDQHGPQPISHSDATIQRFIQAFESPTGEDDPRELVDVLRREGKLEDLALSTHRWLRILVSSPQSLPTETAAKLVMLSNRLVVWCGSEFSAVKSVFAPVDGALLAALQIYSTTQTSTTPQISIVRLSLMVREYLAVSGAPDLVALTAAIVDAALSCAMPSARDGLLKLMQGFGAFLVVDVIAERLHGALLLVGDRTQSRVARNALAILASAPDIFDPRVVSLSIEIFSVPVAEQWLSALLVVGVLPDFVAKPLVKSVEALLACLESLLGLHQRGEDCAATRPFASSTFRHGYVLNALLSTVQLALPHGDKTTSLQSRAREICRQLQSHLLATEPTTGALVSIDNKQTILMVQPQTSEKQQPQKDKRLIEATCSSAIVRVDRRGTTRINAPLHQQGLRTQGEVTLMEVGDKVPADGTTQCYMTFLSFLSSSLMVQQLMGAHSNSVGIDSTWEQLFSEMALQFYLPVQFYGDEALLMAEWLSTWIQQSLAFGQCIELRPFQRSMLLEHLARTNPWKHLIECARSLLADNVPPTESSGIMSYIVNSLNMVVLCSTCDISCDGINSMADDLSALLEQLQLQLLNPSSPIDDHQRRLEMLAPLVEAFVRASLRASASHPASRNRVMDSVKRVAVLMQQVLARPRACVRWWSELLSVWMRRLSHTNRRDAPLVIAAFEYQACDPRRDGGDFEDNKVV